ncbi:HflX-like GTP-binding protein [Allokutzneria oryzae]|uniref:GTPase HflX N-terminal domain-containing protein n=1 Tax=Allokutzneria oryzae TaxID=1378989 RepID=A0ABV6A9E7_9PSEU
MTELGGVPVVLVGLFSAKRKDHEAVVDDLSRRVTARGGSVVGRVVQRRGVSAGGVAKLDQPLSRRTVVSEGKAAEIAALVAETEADLVVFVNDLTARQREVLQERLSAKVISAAELT